MEQFGGEAGGVHGAPPPHPEFGVSASQAVRGVCVCVCVCVCLGVGGVPHQLYGGGRVRLVRGSCPRENLESTRSTSLICVELISEMMILELRLVQVGSGARTVGKRLGRQDGGFDAF